MRKVLCRVALVASALVLALIDAGAAASRPIGVLMAANKCPTGVICLGNRIWAGYSVPGPHIVEADGSFNVPRVFAPPIGDESEWVGIGGTGPYHDLIQAGVTVSSSSPSHPWAWYELLPHLSVFLDKDGGCFYGHVRTRNYRPVPNCPVNPGDVMSVQISYLPNYDWTILILDHGPKGAKTYSWWFEKDRIKYASSMSSAEWILETPDDGSGNVSALPSMAPVTFQGGFDTDIYGGTKDIADGHPTRYVMNDPSGKREATPSAPTTASEFNVCAYPKKTKDGWEPCAPPPAP